MIRQRFRIQGMHCTGCAMTIDGALEELPGVDSAFTHYARQTAEVMYDEQRVTAAPILGAIQAIGYRAAAMPVDQK